MISEEIYLCIGTECFYAAAECARRGLDPYKTNLIVADKTKGEKEMCFSVTPHMKKLGAKERCPVCELPKEINYRSVLPCPAFYADMAADIYAVYLNYFSPADIYIYSAGIAFIYVSPYISMYKNDAGKLVNNIIKDVYANCGIYLSAGTGTNIYLARTALSLAYHRKGHTAYLNEEIYRGLLWDHTPLTDFAGIDRKTAEALSRAGIYSMRKLATGDHGLIYNIAGDYAEILIDHAWGREPCSLKDIKNHSQKKDTVALSAVFDEAMEISSAEKEMKILTEKAAAILGEKKLLTNKIWIVTGYKGEMYAPTYAAAATEFPTADPSVIIPLAEKLFNDSVCNEIPVQRLGISFSGLCDDYAPTKKTDKNAG